MNKITISCLTCKKAFLAFPSQHRVFCSHKCHGINLSKKLKSDDRKLLKFRESIIKKCLSKEKICVGCSKKFIPLIASQRYCGSKNKKTGCSYRKIKLCPKCGNEKSKALFNGVPHRYCEVCRQYQKVGLKARFDFLKKYNFTCQYCGRKAPNVSFEIDHIHPRALGGKSIYENLTLSCVECNRGKGKNLLSENLLSL